MFLLPQNHINRDSTAWQLIPQSRSDYARRPFEISHQKRSRQARPLTEAQLKQGVLEVTILSAISDNGATSSAGLVGVPYIPTGIKSNKNFHMPNVRTAPASDVCKLEHELRDPSRTVDMVPDLVDSSLISTSKLASAGFIKIYDGTEVNIYDSSTTKIIVSEEAVFKRWWCPKSTLWRIPLTSQEKHLTLTLSSYISLTYNTPSIPCMRSLRHIQCLNTSVYSCKIDPRRDRQSTTCMSSLASIQTYDTSTAQPVSRPNALG